jgi:hypothetical protein
MNDKTTLQNHLELFKPQMKEVNESLYQFESQFEQEKAKIEKLRYSFAMMMKLINHDLINSFDDIKDFLQAKGFDNEFKIKT